MQMDDEDEMEESLAKWRNRRKQAADNKQLRDLQLVRQLEEQKKLEDCQARIKTFRETSGKKLGYLIPLSVEGEENSSIPLWSDPLSSSTNLHDISGSDLPKTDEVSTVGIINHHVGDKSIKKEEIVTKTPLFMTDTPLNAPEYRSTTKEVTTSLHNEFSSLQRLNDSIHVEKHIRINRKPGGVPEQYFGLIFSGGVDVGRPVRVEVVKFGSSADLCDVKRYDELLSINGISVVNATLDETLEILLREEQRSLRVNLHIRRQREIDSDDEYSMSDMANLQQPSQSRQHYHPDNTDITDEKTPQLIHSSMKQKFCLDDEITLSHNDTFPAPPSSLMFANDDNEESICASPLPDEGEVDLPSSLVDSRIKSVRARNQFFELNRSCEEETLSRGHSRHPSPRRSSSPVQTPSQLFSKDVRNATHKSVDELQDKFSHTNSSSAMQQPVVNHKEFSQSLSALNVSSPKHVISSPQSSYSSTSSDIEHLSFHDKEVIPPYSLKQDQLPSKAPPKFCETVLPSRMLPYAPSQYLLSAREPSSIDKYKESIPSLHLTHSMDELFSQSHSSNVIPAKEKNVNTASVESSYFSNDGSKRSFRDSSDTSVHSSLDSSKPTAARSGYHSQTARKPAPELPLNTIRPFLPPFLPENDKSPSTDGPPSHREARPIPFVSLSSSVGGNAVHWSSKHSPKHVDNSIQNKLNTPTPISNSPSALVDSVRYKLSDENSRIPLKPVTEYVTSSTPHISSSHTFQKASSSSDLTSMKIPLSHRDPPSQPHYKEEKRIPVEETLNKFAKRDISTPHSMTSQRFLPPVEKSTSPISMSTASSLSSAAVLSPSHRDARPHLVESSSHEKFNSIISTGVGPPLPPKPKGKPAQQTAPQNQTRHSRSHSHSQLTSGSAKRPDKAPSLPKVKSSKICSHCNKELGYGSVMMIDSAKLYFHLTCFQCSTCGKKLGDGTHSADVRIRHGRLHCTACQSITQSHNKSGK